MNFFESIVSFFMAIITFLASLFGGTLFAPEINMDKFELVWADEFDGTQPDMTKWNLLTASTSVRRGGYWNKDLIEVKDGNLIIYSKYLENGCAEGDPAGWYTGAMNTKGLFETTYGYFETRCILPPGNGQWAAFWMNSSNMGELNGEDGSHGGEVDIFEAPYYNYKEPDKVFGAIHWGGYGKGHESIHVTYNIDPVNPYTEYNTYGIEWNEEQYIYYVNGKQAAVVTKDKAVPCQVPLYMILSNEISGSDGVAHNTYNIGCMDDNGRDFVSEFKVDYVRVYQYK